MFKYKCPRLRYYRALVRIVNSNHCACGGCHPIDYLSDGHISKCPIHIAKVALKRHKPKQLRLKFVKGK
jgi:hypothetical protein